MIIIYIIDVVYSQILELGREEKGKVSISSEFLPVKYSHSSFYLSLVLTAVVSGFKGRLISHRLSWFFLVCGFTVLHYIVLYSAGAVSQFPWQTILLSYNENLRNVEL